MNQKLVLFILFFAAIGCKDKSISIAEKKAELEVTSFDWLVGDWKRTNDAEEEQQTYEEWQKKSDLYYNGIGFTMVGVDTVWKEDVVLFENDQDWYFSAKGTHDTIATNFLLTEIKSDYFKCQNVENPYPKMIEYKSVSDRIEAKISGGGDDVVFAFSKNK